MSPFRLSAPLDGTSPVLLASPHSGTYLPAPFLKAVRVPAAALRRLEDAHVGRLLEAASAHAPLIEATHARAVIDLNRAETDMDASVVEGAPEAARSDRTRAGFGLFPRIVAPGMPIYAAPISAREARRRVQDLHRPWHLAIAEGLARARQTHGFALLLDCHSMPPLEVGGAQVVIGDRHGTSASGALVAEVERLFRQQGLRTARNQPYAGGHTLERHGRPADGVHAIQIELCRSLYMHPETLRPHAGLQRLEAVLDVIVRHLAAQPVSAPRLAAE